MNTHTHKPLDHAAHTQHICSTHAATPHMDTHTNRHMDTLPDTHMDTHEHTRSTHAAAPLSQTYDVL